MIVDDQLKAYFSNIEKEVSRAYETARAARKKGFDPEPDVNIPIARDLAARVEGLVSTMAPELMGSGLAEHIRELEKEFGKNDEKVALLAGRDIALNKKGIFPTKEKAIEIGVRVAVGYLTLGIVTAPLEGVSDIKLRKNDDGTDYLAIYFAGPIRSAGGTASAMAVLAADFIRIHTGIAPFKPRDEELSRYATEVEDYYSRVTAKQYHPTEEEIKFIIKNIPVEINGDPTEALEVSNFKDLSRVETNVIRGGMCLVLLDGLPLKAEKLLKRVRKYPKDYELGHWMWLEEFIAMKKQIHAAKKADDDSGETCRYIPNAKYVEKIIAGRPVFAYPATKGGFRLRYGRSRTGGLASTSVHPLTMHLVPFMAVGTQIATELPGKATVCTPCDTIEGPVVRMKSGDVLEIESKDQIKKINHEIDTILSLGDALIPFGEFVSNGHMLLPSSYVEEWWSQEAEQALNKENKSTRIPMGQFMNKPYPHPTLKEAQTISKDLSIPLHPYYNFFWHDLKKDDIITLIDWLADENLEESKDAKKETESVTLKLNPAAKKALDDLCAPHEIRDEKIILKGKSLAIPPTLGTPDKKNKEKLKKTITDTEDLMDAISAIAGIKIMKKGQTRVGMKMGRPEKADKRLMKGRPQVLFPCGEAGGRMRNVTEAYSKGPFETTVSIYRCTSCGEETYYPTCHLCKGKAEKMRACKVCNKLVDTDKHCNMPTASYRKVKLDINRLMSDSLKKTGMNTPPALMKGVKGVFGKDKNIEPLEKGILRAKYELYVNKDGTTRYDSSDVPITHIKPKEIGVSVEKLRECGYEKDHKGDPLERDDQILELYPQDIILSDNIESSAADYLIRNCKFTDELLEKFYGLPPFYNVKRKEDLVGQLVIGLAPHTSAGIVGRIIGFTPARIGFAHPFWHAGKRRNCDGDEDSVLLLTDALINFSRQFMPDTRGGRTMDAPLVLTTCLDPEEVDDESWNMDVDPIYPLGFYYETQDYPNLWDLKTKPRIVSELIGTPEVFHVSFTNDTNDASEGPIRSKYTQLDSMIEKLYAQLDLEKRLLAVDENAVAEAVLSKHFLRDIKGNVRKFAKQGFRCGTCNEKFRRIPLIGRCPKCGNKILLTISEGSTRKYLEPSKRIMDEFRITTYLRQQFMLLEKEADAIFGKKARQMNLASYK